MHKILRAFMLIMTMLSLPQQGLTSQTELEEKDLNKSASSMPVSIPNSLICLKQLKILVAENNSINQKVMSSYLESQGCKKTNIDIVSDGRAALTAVQKRKYDLILTEINLPGLDGILVTNEIFQTLKQKPIIIGVTAEINKEIRELFYQKGGEGCIYKPYTKAQLTDEINRCLTERTKERQ